MTRGLSRSFHTTETITLLAYLASYKGIWGPHLVVVPTSVILNWETELKRFCPSFKVLCYYGSAKRRKELRTGWTKTNVYHVVITSYQLAVQDAFAFKRKRWYYLILDEAQVSQPEFAFRNLFYKVCVSRGMPFCCSLEYQKLPEPTLADFNQFQYAT